MTDTQKMLRDMSKLLSTQTQRIHQLEAEKAALSEELAMWQNTFVAFANAHFEQGGAAPNLPMSAISNTIAPDEIPFEMIDNIEYVTVRVRR